MLDHDNLSVPSRCITPIALRCDWSNATGLHRPPDDYHRREFYGVPDALGLYYIFFFAKMEKKLLKIFLEQI